MTRRGFWAALAAPAASAAELTTARLTPEINRTFQKYVARREAEINRRGKGRPFLWVAENAKRWRQAREEVVVDGYERGSSTKVGDGLAHDWIGSVFIPRVNLQQVLEFVQNYDRHHEFYRPEVVRSRLLERQGERFKVYLRLKKTKIVTVVLDTEYDVRYETLDERRARSTSLSTRIVEIDDPGTEKEKPLPEGHDHGFLWRLNTYWRFAEQDGGAYVECEAISLSRGIPFLAAPLVVPIVRSLPEDSLRHTLEKTRASLTA